ncbi:hypothetical protein L3Y34_000037 [Caenorhabditis briggsae]|nr:hypothetical protein L3Y34_000037 [Caenorhabditis briggsae]
MVVEQIEVIEHRIIEEGRRPSGGALLPHTVPISTIRESRESYEQRADGTIHDRRYEVTGERDVSREPSFLHTSANYGQHIEMSPPQQRYNVSGATNTSFLNTSGDSRLSYPGAANTSNETTVINNYGYDITEVHTNEGGARIIETHGSGPLRETSRIEHVEETITRPSAMRSSSAAAQRSSSNIFTVPAAPTHISYRQEFASDNE